jgi:hypothetical protein
MKAMICPWDQNVPCICSGKLPFIPHTALVDAPSRNTQIIDTCIVFPGWHISSNTSFILSFIVIVLLGVLYEYLRFVQRRVDVYIAQAISNGERGQGRVRSPIRSGTVSPAGGEDRALLTGRKLFKVSSGPGYISGRTSAAQR